MTANNKKALITGSCGGIGSVVAKDFSAKGYELILVDINEEANQALSASLPKATAITLDLTDRQALREFCKTIPDFKLDIAFINAGFLHIGDVTDVTEDQLDLHLEINLRSAMILTQACVKDMQARRTGHVIHTVSMGSIVYLRRSAAYSASKAGLRAFLFSLREEVEKDGVKISGIYPSAVDTPMLRYEARHGGNALNFMSVPKTPEDVLAGVNKALKTGKLEIYVPYIDSIGARIANGFPNIAHLVFPVLEKLGERGRKKFLKDLDRRGL